ncbi:MAG: efflux transporter outer membrane subunit [Pseudomonadota bacterium]|nr:efflux transporter outer membrane subunit [Pseudomonadota bacterium]
MVRTSASMATAAALLAMSACTVGPDYRGPPTVAPQADAAGAFRRAGDETATVNPPARWWEALHDPVLSELVERGLHNSPNLQAAEARIRQARAVLGSRQSDALPKATATGAAIRATVPPGSPLAALSGGGSSGGAGGADAPPPGRKAFNVFNAGFDATWELDLFGGVRRGVEGARAQVAASVARYEDVQVQLAAEIGQAYTALRSQQLQIALANRIESAQQKLLDLQRARRRYGTADDRSIEPARAQLIQTRASAAPLPGQLAQSLDQLALLTGQEPGTLDAMLVASAADPGSVPVSAAMGSAPALLPPLPTSVAVGDPRAMLRRRPDVRAAERVLAASNAAIGSAVAQRFPSVTLFGNIGFTNGQFPKLLQVDSLSALGGPILRWNFLNFGAVQAGIDQAEAANDEALANYRGAVLQALQDAESSLARFGQQRRTLAQRIDGVASAERQFHLARVRQVGGTASMLDVWLAESRELQAEQARVMAEAELLRDFIALQKSLGLGWQPRPAG